MLSARLLAMTSKAFIPLSLTHCYKWIWIIDLILIPHFLNWRRRWKEKKNSSTSSFIFTTQQIAIAFKCDIRYEREREVCDGKKQQIEHNRIPLTNYHAAIVCFNSSCLTVAKRNQIEFNWNMERVSSNVIEKEDDDFTQKPNCHKD